MLSVMKKKKDEADIVVSHLFRLRTHLKNIMHSCVTFNKYFGVVWKAVPMPLTKGSQRSLSVLKAWHWCCPQTWMPWCLKTEMSGSFAGWVPGRHQAGASLGAALIGTGQKQAGVCCLSHHSCEPGWESCPACFLFIRIDPVKRLYP